MRVLVLTTALFVLCLVPSATFAADCEPPRIRDTTALTMAIIGDRQVGQSFERVAFACAAEGQSCDQARLQCSTLLTATMKEQATFDEGWWLRDMMLPYQGQTYPFSQKFFASPLANDATCNGDALQLTAAAQRRSQQATRRQVIADEYPRYVRWITESYNACMTKQVADAQQQMKARTQAEQAASAAAAAAATAAVAKAAEDARLREAEAARLRAEAEQKRLKDLDAKAADQRELAQRKAEEDARQKSYADERARQDQIRAEQKAEDDKVLAKRAADDKVVQDREALRANQQAQKEKLVADAEAALDQASQRAERARAAARDALDKGSPAASALAAESTAAERDRVAAEQRLVEAREKANSIVVDNSHNRSRFSAAAFGGITYADISSADGRAEGPLASMGVAAHFGIWGTPPVEGLPSGFEFRLVARGSPIWSSGLNRVHFIDTTLTMRWFFSRFGVGVAGELRWNETLFGGTSFRKYFGGGVGPSLGVALVDSPEGRILISLNWTPIISNDLLRIFGDIELSWRFLTLHLAVGGLTDPTQPSARTGFFASANAGVRWGF